LGIRVVYMAIEAGVDNISKSIEVDLSMGRMEHAWNTQHAVSILRITICIEKTRPVSIIVHEFSNRQTDETVHTVGHSERVYGEFQPRATLWRADS